MTQTEARARLARTLRLRPGEGRPVALAVAVSFVASAGLMVGGSAIEALFFARFGAERLPVMYLLLGGTMFLATIGFSALLGRLGRGRACLLIPSALGVLAILGRAGLTADVSWITPALWLVQGVAQFLVGLAVWGLAGIVTDTRQAKRFFPLIGAGSVLGYVAGGLGTKPLAAALGTPNLLLVWTASLAGVVGIGAALVRTGGRGSARRMPRARDEGPIEQLRRGLRHVRRSELMRWMALGSVLFSLLFYSLYLPFSRAATARYPDPDELAGFFGVFFAASTGLAFAMSLFLTNRLLARFGVPSVMLVLPLLYAIAFGVLAVGAGFAALATFRFAQVAWLQGGAVSATEAVINTVPPDRRDHTRAFLYGGPTQVGTVLAGVIALVGEQRFAPSTLYGVGFVAAVLALVAMLGVRRAYPRELVAALREGRPHVFDAAPAGTEPFMLARADQTALAVALGGLTDPDVRVRRVAAHALGGLGGAAAVEGLVDALNDADAEVRAAAVRSLGRVGATAAMAHVLARCVDDDASVRVATIDAIGRMGASVETATHALGPLLHDREPAVRARAAARALRLTPADPTGPAILEELALSGDDDVRGAAMSAMAGLDDVRLAGTVEAGLRDPSPVVRAGSARALATIEPDRAVALLPPALGDPHPTVRAAVAEALGGIGPAATAPIVRALDEPELRAGAVAALEHVPLDGAGDALHRFAAASIARSVESHRLGAAITDGDAAWQLLRDSLIARSDREALLALRAAALLEGSRTMSVAIESLSVTDPAQRANALEVIESVGARDLVRPLLSMWDGAAAGVRAATILERLQTDDDVWIRACAELARGTTEGATMTTTLTTLSPMERVLFLRQVALFADLPPADLMPVAEIARERSFVDGETIAEQDEPGAEMHIIVSGEVSVVVRDGDGTRAVAVRSTGDVVGEMAVITDRPRVASLLARGDVRVLSIERPRFEAILRERPETAIGVIRVLCQRLAERNASVDAG